MAYHCPLFTGNVLKVRLSCVKPSEKNREKNQQKNPRDGEKNQDRGRIYTPELEWFWSLKPQLYLSKPRNKCTIAAVYIRTCCHDGYCSYGSGDEYAEDGYSKNLLP